MDPESKDSTDVELTTDRFDDLDIDEKTKKVLRSKGYVYLTKVQSKVLPLALSGKNLVIQSPTGSGKTLCFLLPAVKHLFDDGYSGNLPIDANLLGCICLAPTRELASQIALQMKDLAAPLKLNSGCCIGGVRDKYDKKTANRLHILTGTPGRILALLSSQSLPDTYNIKMLSKLTCVLDEADRLIDIGFRNDIISIVDFLPKDLHFMFFSATIKSSLKELCNLLLKDVSYELVCLGADVDAVSESKLRQEFLCIPPKFKLTALFCLLSKHQNKRIIVFLSTCKLVRFMYEAFKRMIPAIPMTELHGKQSQNKRLTQFTRFAAKQNHGCIFTTDLAARGIDFPSVDLVIQFDLPDSVSTYTHRVGRTGRLSVQGFRNYGRTVLLVSEAEREFIAQVKSNGITVHDLTKLSTPLIQRREDYVTRKFQAILAKEAWIKEMAQRSLVAHLRYVTTRGCVRLNSRDIINEINELSLSMGLPYSPNIQLVDADAPNPPPKKSKLSKLKEKLKFKRSLKLKDESSRMPASDNHVPRLVELDGETLGHGQSDDDNSVVDDNDNSLKSDVDDSGSDNTSDDDQDNQSHDNDQDDQSDNEGYNRSDDDHDRQSHDVDDGQDEDDILFLSKTDADTDIAMHANLSRDPDRDLKKKLSISRSKLRLNRRGVAKLRGVVTLKEAEQNHKFFSDDEFSEAEVEKTQYISKLQEDRRERDPLDKAEYCQIRRERKRSKKLR
ncbi:ATP-dependent RNA helicase [Theileria orientalis strain Shintoku]|uniref:ATP-dependent RNA helicase n=1 Tax=Theileria orientalis strain Shintoku TaxID=869250 RepID=J4DP76_THEOR|nr:ATP-dependent RNA helicase [Theileria orientalis strain Shintoku]PVC51640.1 ATP-dependent RNA helicase [Theileria orientalis]BAM40224.1 ATP-dependent RNA helicase [Theileria orientalis strain Shintoku]|eukprot:XP_009690525.1 ATP-dependent RNA helicase [Theileria orientalis strain Shintoku]